MSHDASPTPLSFIHFPSTVEAVSEESALFIIGDNAEEPSLENLGMQDYTSKPQAIVVGAYFTNSMFDEMCDK